MKVTPPDNTASELLSRAHFLPGGFHSKYFLVCKKDGSFRPILDLRCQNRSLKQLPFRMLHVIDVLHVIVPCMWFTSVYLKDAYFHIPIAPHHRKFLRLTFQGRTYQYQVLPYGLLLSLCVFHTMYASGTRTFTAGGHVDYPVPGRLVALCQDTSTGDLDTFHAWDLKLLTTLLLICGTCFHRTFAIVTLSLFLNLV